MNDLKGKVCIITGATRGIGLHIALTLAKLGVHIIVVGKSTESKPNLPGSIYDTMELVRSVGKLHNVKSLSIKCNVLVENEVKEMIEKTINYFGRIDILINNASALWWTNIEKTPMKKYDLINGVNSRGTFMCTKYALPYLKKTNGKIITMSPPIYLDMIPGKIAYSISKFGMTIVTHGLAKECNNISINSLWPATMVESYATKNFKLGERKHWRKASIISDSVVHILQEPTSFSGNTLIDEDYLRTKGVTDFDQYKCEKDGNPVRIIGDNWNLSVGHVKDKGNFVKIKSNL